MSSHEGAAVSIIPFHPSRGLRIVRAEGQYVWDSAGRRYLDFHTGHGAAFLGHRNPRIIKALAEQMQRFTTATPAFETDTMEECLKKLGHILPRHLNMVFFQNSGAEAVELALKTARKTTKRKKFLAFINAFHGRTMGALSVTWNPKYREGYDPFPWETKFIPYNNVEAVEKSLNEEYAAVIVEPVQGEGGVVPASVEFLRVLEERCRSVGALLIVDEIQSGFGRTGRIWAHEHAGVKPDILVAGKSIAGGFPASMAAISGEIASSLKEGDHGSTHGGNPLALAAIAAGVETLLEEDVAGQAAQKGSRMAAKLEKLVGENQRIFRGLRAAGLMIGLEMRIQPAQTIKQLQANGLIAIKAGLNVLRFLPPYLITDHDINESIEILRETISK